MDKEIIEILKNIGMRVDYYGYKYYFTAIKYVLNKETYSMREVYEQVAKKHKTTAHKAEKAMWYILDTIHANRYFKVDYKITNSILLTLIVQELKLCSSLT